MRRNRKKILRWVPLLLLVCILGTASFVAAKYVSMRQNEAEIHASSFHFSAEYLEPQTALVGSVPEFTVSDWNTAGISFRVYNYEKENTAQISETEMKYKVTVPSGWTVSVADASGKTVRAAGGNYTFPQSASGTYQTVTLTYTGSGMPDTLDVSVTSTEPYSLKLEAKFRLEIAASPEVTLTGEDDSYVLTIEANGYTGSASVVWDTAKMCPDTIDTENTADIGGWTNSGSGTVALEAYHTYRIRFLMLVPGSAAAESDAAAASGVVITLQ